jgi:hypothetical protein
MDFDWEELQAGDFILVDCTIRQDPTTYTRMFNEHWLKNYTEALFMEQWGRNLSKYDGIQMLGGVKLNGRQILEDGVKQKERLEQEIRTTFELPPLDLIG